MYLNELVNTSAVRQPRELVKNLGKKGYYESVRWTLFVCRCTGLLPLAGLQQTESQLTRFEWNKTYALIYIVSMAVQFAKLVFDGIYALYIKVYIQGFITFLLDMNLFIVEVYMILFCMNWSKVMSEVETIELTLPPLTQKGIKRIRKFTAMIAILDMAGYAFYTGYRAVGAVACRDYFQHDSPFKTFLVKKMPAVYEQIPFDYFSALLFMLSTFQLRTVFTFIDILVINVSMYLIIRFEEFNKLLQEKEKELSHCRIKQALPWEKIQQKYTKLMKLTHIIGQHITPIVFFSFCNFIMIGRQFYLMLNSHRDLTFPKDCQTSAVTAFRLYQNLYGCIFSITKMVVISGLAAHVHTLSRRSLNALYTIPAFSYNKAFQRFVDQVYHSNISLNGFRCFYVTRQMILSMLASLLTFELMLMDNNSN